MFTIRFIPLPAYLDGRRTDNLTATFPFSPVNLESLNLRAVPPQVQVYILHIVSLTAIKENGRGRLLSGGCGKREIPSFHFRSSR